MGTILTLRNSHGLEQGHANLLPRLPPGGTKPLQRRRRVYDRTCGGKGENMRRKAGRKKPPVYCMPSTSLSSERDKEQQEKGRGQQRPSLTLGPGLINKKLRKREIREHRYDFLLAPLFACGLDRRRGGRHERRSGGKMKYEGSVDGVGREKPCLRLASWTIHTLPVSNPIFGGGPRLVDCPDPRLGGAKNA